jgi:type IV pilus assembly protein PilV
MRTRRHQRGTFLLEALVALVVLSLASAGLLGIVAHALRESGNARWRAEAFDLAASTFARMAADDVAQLDARYAATTGDGYRALLGAATRLPGVGADTNAPEVAIDATASGARRVAISVRWQVPGEGGAHRASIGGVIP